MRFNPKLYVARKTDVESVFHSTAFRIINEEVKRFVRIGAKSSYNHLDVKLSCDGIDYAGLSHILPACTL